MHWRWLLSQLLTAPTRRPGQSHVLIPASRTERLVIVHCSSLSRVFSEPMTSFECIKPTKETFERLTAPVGCARRACAGAEVAGGRPILNVELVSSRCIARRHPSRTALPARASSFDAASRQLGCGHQRGEMPYRLFNQCRSVELSAQASRARMGPDPLDEFGLADVRRCGRQAPTLS